MCTVRVSDDMSRDAIAQMSPSLLPAITDLRRDETPWGNVFRIGKDHIMIGLLR